MIGAEESACQLCSVDCIAQPGVAGFKPTGVAAGAGGQKGVPGTGNNESPAVRGMPNEQGYTANSGDTKSPENVDRHENPGIYM